MKGYLLKSAGVPDSLKIHELPEPNPLAGEVKVKIHYIGINYAEVLSRKGQYSWAPKLPYIPGMEAVGEVVAIGDQVTSHQVGDMVITGGQTGAYAEYICVDQSLAFPCPKHLSIEENAALLVNFMTAWVALIKLGRITKGDTVLIHAAAGGVGTAAVQIARAMDTIVIGTASSEEKLELVSSLGADAVINYAKEDFEKEIRSTYGGVNMVLEVVGGDVFKKSVNLLKPFGRLVVTGFASISLNKWNPLTWWKTWWDAPKANIMKMAKGSYGIMATHIGYLTDDKEVIKNEWQNMLTFIEAHEIKPVVGKVFEFDQLSEAHKYMESRRSTGKILVRV